jgi:predicted esterase
MASVAIDAPEHGDRAQCDDPEEIAAAWRRHWQQHGASMIAEELSRAIDQVGEQEGVDTSRIGYWGLSLGTQYGLGFVASTDRVRAAVLGLFGMPHIAPRMSEFVAHVHCPVFFIAQRDDEIHPLDRAQALFEAIASKDKELIVSDGGHMNVPSPVLKRSYDFLAERLRD